MTEKSQLVVKIDNQKMKITPKITNLKRKTWYSMNVSVRDTTATIQLNQWMIPEFIINNTFNSVESIRLTEEAHIHTGDTIKSYNYLEGSLFDTRVYINNAITNNEYKLYKSLLRCDSNCQACNHKLECILCKESFILQLGDCIDTDPGQGKILLQKKTIYNKDSYIIKLSDEILNLDEYTISLFFRIIKL